MTDSDTQRNPFKRSGNAKYAEGLVLFCVSRLSNQRIAKAFAKMYLNNMFGESEGKIVLKRGYFLTDTFQDALACEQILKRMRDNKVSQYVFEARAFNGKKDT